MSRALAEMDGFELGAELASATEARRLAEYQDGWDAYTRAVGAADERTRAVKAEIDRRTEAIKAEIDQLAQSEIDRLRDAGDDDVSEGG